ncbi:zinc/manganese transport system substrate-binding protein [Paenarthrobacter nitroguajacolicus]|uniref:metal ABC transporter solute-binding protein, Zn/Mn family n=1 Tax=Paenarthrobacter nitroguajacolicus TaxID=211146 RepID=UPI00285E44EA|nr:zinc ABC transporter substrate-binding protein [Paenarthrobacter nitroguajacolicus]MDR6988919.1 zinc/manganese transport system substrate-binding protein [Paenarthrobacter nitroguajacolicus]
MRRSAARLSMAASAGIAALLLSSCAGTAGANNSSSSGAIEVVTSTNVYGDVVKAIGGDKVNVNAIITKTSQDPHSYEANAQDKLVISKAKLVVENGGGYDGFLHKIADETKVGHENMISAVEISGLAPEEEAHSEEAHGEEGHTHDHGEFNEHVWYSLETMGKLADAVAGKLGSLDAGSAATFTANTEAFKAKLADLTGKLDAIKAANEHVPVAVTEPVPLYLLEAAGLENKTPEAYSAAIEEETDVPAAVLKETTDLVSAKSVRFLAYNQQTEGPQTEAVKRAAEAADVPVVNFTETLPDGKDYLQWMADNVESVSSALKK